MNFRLGLAVGCVSAVCAAFGGCSGNVDGGAGSGGTGGGTADDPDEPGYVYSGTCSAEAVETECGDDCPVTSDHSVRCDVYDWAAHGPRVAPRFDRDGAFLAVNSPQIASFISLEPGAEPTFADLPAGLANELLHFSQSPAGVPALSVLQRVLQETGWVDSVVVVEPLGPSPAEPAVELPVDPDSGEIHAFGYDAEGDLHLAYLSGPDTVTQLLRAAGDTDFEEVVSMPWESALLLTSAGDLLPLNPRLGPTDGIHFTLDFGAGPVALHEEVAADARPLVGAPALPTDGSAGTGDFALGWVTPSELLVVAGAEAGWSELRVPLTPLQRLCAEYEDDIDGDCPDPCEQLDDGVDPESVALARTADGRLWAAWLHAFVDETQEYTQACSYDDATICSCTLHRTRYDTRAELVLVELVFDELEPQGGSAREVLRVPSPDADSSGLRPNASVLELRSLGNELAIGLRTRAPDADPLLPRVRVLELDAVGL